MLFRSTGLGKAELIADLVDVKRQGDYLIMEMQTTEPVRWKIRGGVNRKDLRVLIKAVFKLSVLAFFFNLQGWFKQAAHPGDY